MTITSRPILTLLLTAALAAPATAQSAPAAQSGDEAAVRAVLEHYLAGHATGQSSHFEQAFHEVADLYWMVGDTLRTRTSEAYIAGASGRPAEDEDRRSRRIAWIDVAGTAAVARIELDYPGVFFVDYMSLLKTAEGWRIVNKTFDVNRSGAGGGR